MPFDWLLILLASALLVAAAKGIVRLLQRRGQSKWENADSRECKLHRMTGAEILELKALFQAFPDMFLRLCDGTSFVTANLGSLPRTIRRLASSLGSLWMHSSLPRRLVS